LEAFLHFEVPHPPFLLLQNSNVIKSFCMWGKKEIDSVVHLLSWAVSWAYGPGRQYVRSNSTCHTAALAGRPVTNRLPMTSSSDSLVYNQHIYIFWKYGLNTFLTGWHSLIYFLVSIERLDL